jgi:Flp pilus assembly protein TadG
MRIRRNGLQNRRGVSAVESAIVYPVTMILLIGTIAVSLGNFRYQQLQSLAREGARYASVRGPNYVAANSGASSPTAADVQAYLLAHAGSSMSSVTCTNVTYSATTDPCTVSVTVSYTWNPGAYFNPMTWTATSTMPVTY